MLPARPISLALSLLPPQRNRSSTTRSPLLSQTLLLPTLLSPLILLLFFAYSFLPPSPLPPFFHLTTSLYALSALFELLAERFYLETLLDWEGLTGARVRVEGMAVGGKAVGTLLTIMWGGERCALVAFGAGQVVYGAVLLLGLGWSVGRKVEWAWPRKLEGGKVYFDPATTELSWALTKQSFVKQFLTEGDKIVVGRLSKVEDQGGYAIALNYGSSLAPPLGLAPLTPLRLPNRPHPLPAPRRDFAPLLLPLPQIGRAHV